MYSIASWKGQSRLAVTVRLIVASTNSKLFGDVTGIEFRLVYLMG